MKELFTLVPNDPALFYTKMLSLSFSRGRDELYKFLSDRIDAEDIDPMILCIYSVIHYKENKRKEALKYFKSKKRKAGFGIEKFKYMLNRDY